MSSRNSAVLALFAILLTACQPAAPRRPSAAGGVAGRLPPGARLYRIDGGASMLQVLVYRAGALAALGHDHVITNVSLDGWIVAAHPVAASSFQVDIPTGRFIVDDDAARRAAGADFTPPVPAQAREGTRAHMLGPALLDAARYPSIVVRSVAIRRSGPSFEAAVEIRIAGRKADLTVPFTLSRSRDRLAAGADFTVRQTALGLTPYSVMLGALRVRDQIRLSLRIVAIAQRPRAEVTRPEPG